MSSGGSCSTHEECGEQTVCSGGSCVAGYPGQKCSSQSECGPDSPCRYGRCWSPAASGDGSTGNQCNSSDQCEEHEIWHMEHAHLQCHLQQSAQEMKNVQGGD
ncbi:conserved hypothetical protein, partial [Trichinella spiralis]|uniref:hypothetical protein n=1 Tax=Trichinella spiralis TaxID=6334 RepID=UPI0001EFD54C